MHQLVVERGNLTVVFGNDLVLVGHFGDGDDCLDPFTQPTEWVIEFYNYLGTAEQYIRY